MSKKGLRMRKKICNLSLENLSLIKPIKAKIKELSINIKRILFGFIPTSNKR